jgi:hypothetical protein
LQPHIVKAMTALLTGLALSACAAGTPSAGGPGASGSAATPASLGQRDLTADEKKAIIAAVSPNLRDPGSARYHWAKFPALPMADSVNYCATVDGKSPYAAYDGRQAYIVEAKVSGGRVTAATMGLIAGGKDAGLVAKMCAKYGLDPNKAI